MLNTSKTYGRLEAANIEDHTARLIVRSLETALVENNLEQSRILATKHGLAQLCAETKQGLADLRGELRVEIANLKFELIRWTFVLLVALVPIIALLIKFIR